MDEDSGQARTGLYLGLWKGHQSLLASFAWLREHVDDTLHRTTALLAYLPTGISATHKSIDSEAPNLLS